MFPLVLAPPWPGLLRSVPGWRMLRIFQRRISGLARWSRWRRSWRILRRDCGIFQGRVLGGVKRESLARTLGWIGGCFAHDGLLVLGGIARHQVQPKQCARSVAHVPVIFKGYQRRIG